MIMMGIAIVCQYFPVELLFALSILLYTGDKLGWKRIHIQIITKSL